MDEVVLYRCRTPTDRLCSCGRVARELARRDIAFEQHRVPWRRSERSDVEALSGQTVVPVLVIGGEPICDSRRIVEHLEWRDDERKRASSVEHGEAARR